VQSDRRALDSGVPTRPGLTTSFAERDFANSFQHFKNKMVNENHNTRIAIHDAREWPCGVGLESKFSTSDSRTENYVAARLGDLLDSEGTARMSTKQ
jgi:hypothetical protein